MITAFSKSRKGRRKSCSFRQGIFSHERPGNTSFVPRAWDSICSLNQHPALKRWAIVGKFARGNAIVVRKSKFEIPVRLLDRYVIRNFLQVYLYCIAGFISIWLIFDISDNISTFIDEHVGLLLTVQYYLTQVPQVFIILLPVSLLLALLFSLGRMSRANEIVSMLTAGVSLSRTLRPLLAIGLFTTLVSLGLNYSAAPHAELARRNYLSTGKSMEGNRITGEVFRNRKDARTWFIQSFQPGENVFYNVQILQQDEQDNIVTNYL